MRVALLSSAIVLVAMTAAPASAQQAASGSAAGLRYLSWPGKPAAAATTNAPAATTDLRPALPAEYAPQAAPASSSVYGYTPAPQRMASNGLTPASNWLRPATEPAAYSAPTPYAPVPTATASTPNPVFVPQPAPQPQTQPQPMRAPVQQQPMVEQPLVQAPPIQSGPIPTVATPTARLVQAQPPLQLPEPQPQAQQQVQQQAADPMAPRRDAPIFRIQGQQQSQAQSQTQPTAASADPQAQTYQTAQAAPASGSARYYSVHRPLGRTPDPAPQPQPVYLDALPVELISPPQSADLAEPQSSPALIRSQDGTVRAAPAASEGDHQ